MNFSSASEKMSRVSVFMSHRLSRAASDDSWERRNLFRTAAPPTRRPFHMNSPPPSKPHIMRAVALSAGRIAPICTAPISHECTSDASAAPWAPTSYTLEGRRCLYGACYARRLVLVGTYSVCCGAAAPFMRRLRLWGVDYVCKSSAITPLTST